MAAELALSRGHQKNNSSRDEIYEKNSRIHLDRLQNKYTNYKGIKITPVLDKLLVHGTTVTISRWTVQL